jgi:hypothetical protein
MITLEEARNLKPGDYLVDSWGKRWKVNGKVKTWVRSPEKVKVPVKHGLYSYDYITEDLLHLVSKEK